MPRLPITALALGLGGLIPFIACALGAVATSDALQAEHALVALIAYGAVILAFLGGAHWGFVLGAPTTGAAPASAALSIRARLILGVVPALVGWAALLIPLIGLMDVALAILLAGFVALTAAEANLRRRDLIPAGYMMLRWGLSIMVVLILSTVLVLRLVGGRITF